MTFISACLQMIHFGVYMCRGICSSEFILYCPVVIVEQKTPTGPQSDTCVQDLVKSLLLLLLHFLPINPPLVFFHFTIRECVQHGVFTTTLDCEWSLHESRRSCKTAYHLMQKSCSETARLGVLCVFLPTLPAVPHISDPLRVFFQDKCSSFFQILSFSQMTVSLSIFHV